MSSNKSKISEAEYFDILVKAGDSTSSSSHITKQHLDQVNHLSKKKEKKYFAFDRFDVFLDIYNSLSLSHTKSFNEQ